MDKYSVKIYARAYQDLDEIYRYIAKNLMEKGTAIKMAQASEEAIYSLEQLPERGTYRQTGSFANHNYRELFVKNYIIIYRVLKEKKEVHIVTIRYAARQF